MPTTTRDFSRASDTGLNELATKLKRATSTAPVEADNYKHAVQSKPATVTIDRSKRFEKITENPFYQIATSKEEGMRLPNQKRDAAEKLLAFDASKTIAENEAMTKAYMLFVEFMEEEHLQSSKMNLANQNSRVFAELNKVMDEFTRGVTDFKTDIGPFKRRLDSIYKIRTSGNAVGLLEEIIQDKRAIHEGKLSLEQHTALLAGQEDKLRRLTEEITGIQTSIEDLGQEYRLGFEWLGVKSDAQREITLRTRERDAASSASEALISDVERTREAIAEAEALVGSPRDTKFSDLASDKAEIAAMLDISSEDHIKAHEALKAKTIGFIETAETRIDAVLANIEDVNALTAKTARKTSNMVVVGAIMNEAVKKAMVRNQETLVTYQLPEDPSAEDEISKAEREEMRSAVLHHIKRVTLADESTTSLRNSLTRTKDNFDSMLQTNEERIRGTRQLRSTGISSMAAETAVTFTALADAANAEAMHVSQAMVDEMSKTVIDIRSMEVIRQATEMGIRNQQLADIIVMTRQADKVARVGIDEQRRHLTTMNKSLSDITDVTASLQETLKQGEAVYAQADADAKAELAARGEGLESANDDTPVSRRSTPPAGPAPGDAFGG